MGEGRLKVFDKVLNEDINHENTWKNWYNEFSIGKYFRQAKS